VTALKSDKIGALLAYLAVEANRPHRREKLAAPLWPEQPDQRACTSLRQALSNPCKPIGDQRASPPFLLISRQTVQFNNASDRQVNAVSSQKSHDDGNGCEPNPVIRLHRIPPGNVNNPVLPSS
jgi:DNA-binding SARP family transcriptional activator